MSALAAGTLRRRFRVERRIEVPDTEGQPRESWEPYAAVAGALAPVSGSERFRAEQIEGFVSHKITTRWVEGATAKMRLVDDRGRTFDVAAVFDPDDRRRALVWLVEGEGV